MQTSATIIETKSNWKCNRACQFEAQIQLNVNYSACCNTKSFKHVVDN